MSKLRVINAHFFDPATESEIRGGTLVTDDGVISWLGSNHDAPVQARDERVVDVRGRIVLPGLIDTHIHLASFADCAHATLVGVTEETVVRATLRGAASARRMLRSGVTTARDCGAKHAGIFALRDSIEKGETRGPRLVVSGAGITRTGGTGFRTSAHEADGVERIMTAVRERLRDGADVIKFFTTGGTLHPSAARGGVQYWPEELIAGIKEAHAVGKRVCVHAEAVGAIAMALDCGADSIEHGTELDEACARRMVQQGTFLVPTLWHYQKVVLAGADYGFGPDIIEIARDRRDAGSRAFRNALDAGVKVASGTDSGGPRYRSGSLHLELRYMGVLGMPAKEVLRTATCHAASCLGLERTTGGLRVGLKADLASFEGNPIESLSALERPWLVVKDGVVEMNGIEDGERVTEPAHAWLVEQERTGDR